jgi:hypothetical protein
LSEKKTIYLNFKNFENLMHFANILNTITINIDDINSENYDLNYAIIFIAGRTFYRKAKNNTVKLLNSPNKDLDKLNTNQTGTLSDKNELMSNNSLSNNNDNLNKQHDDKVYLSALLSRNKLYSSKSFWTDLIELKIARKLEEIVRKTINNNPSIKKKEKENYNETSNYSNSTINTTVNNAYLNYNNPGLFSSVGSKLKGLFKGGKSSKTSNASQIQTKEFQPTLTRDNLLDNYVQVNDSIKYQESSIVLKEFIVHFANFNLEITDAMNIIVEIATKYNFPKERISLYVTILNSYSFTVKNQLPSCIKRKTPKTQRLTNDYNLNTLIDKNIEALFRSTIFLESSDILNLICLNKYSLNILSHKLYSIKLKNLDATDTKERIKIWKTLLRTVRLIL